MFNQKEEIAVWTAEEITAARNRMADWNRRGGYSGRLKERMDKKVFQTEEERFYHAAVARLNLPEFSPAEEKELAAAAKRIGLERQRVCVWLDSVNGGCHG